MASQIDYDRAFARYKVLHAVKRCVDILLLEHPDYRVVAQSPFLIHPSGGLYLEQVVTPSLMRYWVITDEHVLATEIESIARCSLTNALEPEIFEHFNARCRMLLPWLTKVRRVADRIVVKRLSREGLLN